MRRRTADTSRASLHDVQATLGERQQFVRTQLAAFQARYDCWPTALELLRFIKATVPGCAQWDVNSVRPRLTEMKEQGDVTPGVKRICTASGKLAYTWRPAVPVAPRYEDLSHARQVELF